MRKMSRFSEGCVVKGMKQEALHKNQSMAVKSKGIVFQGWKRYEEAEEEE
ncbi:hypothetical protein LZ575_16565 [Antarcticibacterium sp. 1MA-6-2]|nr:hypothetical protein [Antarcticibacterium sp. 1MA-6-2]UJH90427.1 hypothetical protein LZ575_16565 [Antarcticibacterium sp. 1MA-6-2]